MPVGVSEQQPGLPEKARVTRVAERQEIREPDLADAVLLRRQPSHAERRQDGIIPNREARFQPRIELAGAAAARCRDADRFAAGGADPLRTMALDPSLEDPLLDRARRVEEKDETLARNERPRLLGRRWLSRSLAVRRLQAV